VSYFRESLAQIRLLFCTLEEKRLLTQLDQTRRRANRSSYRKTFIRLRTKVRISITHVTRIVLESRWNHALTNTNKGKIGARWITHNCIIKLIPNKVRLFYAVRERERDYRFSFPLMHRDWRRLDFNNNSFLIISSRYPHYHTNFVIFLISITRSGYESHNVAHHPLADWFNLLQLNTRSPRINRW